MVKNGYLHQSKIARSVKIGKKRKTCFEIRVTLKYQVTRVYPASRGRLVPRSLNNTTMDEVALFQPEVQHVRYPVNEDK